MKKVKDWYLLDDEADIENFLINKDIVWHRNLYESTIKSLSTTNNVFVDIGANYGFISAMLAPFFDKVYAFELIPATYDCLVKNMEKFPNVECMPYGLGNKEETLWTMRRKRTAGHSQIINDKKNLDIWLNGNHHKAHLVEIKEAAVKTLDSFKFDCVDLIKIDVEGFEEYVLEGAKDTIKEFMPAICLEVSNPKKCQVIRHIDCLKLLEDWGYTVVKNIRDDYFLKSNKDLGL